MRMNKRLQALYTSAQQDVGELSVDLMATISEGFVIEDGCIFLKSLYHNRGPVSRDSFADEVAYECYVDHIHIDSDCCEHPLAMTLSFLNVLEQSWKSQALNGTLRVIVSSDDLGNCVLRFHLARNDQSWLDDDLESYEDCGILVADLEHADR